MCTQQKIVLCLFALMIVAKCSNTNFDNLNIEQLLSNEQQRKFAFACLMDQKPCGEMQWLRDTIPEMIETKCSHCTMKEKKKYDNLSKVLFEKQPEIFKALVFKYSPKENASE